MGHYLKELGPQWVQLHAALPVRGGVSNIDIVRAYLGLLGPVNTI